jgi:hypothetical protein
MPQSGDPMQSVRDEHLRLVVKAQAGGDFRAAPKEGFVDPAQVTSWEWCDRIFRLPLQGPEVKARLSYHVASLKDDIDLFWFRVAVDSVPVSIYEASSYFVVFVPATAFPGRDVAEKASRAAQRLFALDSPVTFKRITDDRTHESYSTDPNRPYGKLGTWSRRIDVVVFGGDLTFVIYKCTYDDMMTLVSSPSRWFESLHQKK